MAERFCETCGRKLDFQDRYCDMCGKSQYPCLNQLFSGHKKLNFVDVSNHDLPFIESRLGPLLKTCANLESVFKADVNTVSEFDSFLVCLRFATLLCRITNSTTFIARSATKTPDMKVNNESQTIYFEVTRLEDKIGFQPMKLIISVTPLDKVEQAFLNKVDDKLKQAAACAGSFILVIESQRDWNSGQFPLQAMQVEISKIVGAYSNISGIILLYQELSCPNGSRPEGVFIRNTTASHPISSNGPAELENMLRCN